MGHTPSPVWRDLQNNAGRFPACSPRYITIPCQCRLLSTYAFKRSNLQLRAVLYDDYIVEMKVITTFHPPSSVGHSLKCTLSPDQSFQHLVVAKLNILEVYSAHPDGLRLECTTEIYGRISAIRSITKNASALPAIWLL